MAVIPVTRCCCSRSRAHPGQVCGDLRDGSLSGEVGWVACAGFRLAREVAYLQAGGRRIQVPRHGYAIVVWKAPPSPGSPARPPIVAAGEDGSRLTELSPRSHLDSLTWAAIEAASAED